MKHTLGFVAATLVIMGTSCIVDTRPATPQPAPAPAPAAPAGPDVSAIGCSDGSREGFMDLARYPNVASCAATWSGNPSLRAPKTGRACGNGLGPCAVPADACAPGWHICGMDGTLRDFAMVSEQECHSTIAGDGVFVLASSHCSTHQGCVYQRPYPCFPNGWCSEPIACGSRAAGRGMCQDGLYPRNTTIPVSNMSLGCGALPGGVVTGVICCRD